MIEHLRNPLEALVTASSYLRTGGVVFIQIPTLRGVELGKEFGQYWALLDLPRHLSFLSKECLADLCEKAGMKLIMFKTPPARNCVVLLRECLVTAPTTPGDRRDESSFEALSLALLSILSFPYMAIQAWPGAAGQKLLR